MQEDCSVCVHIQNCAYRPINAGRCPIKVVYDIPIVKFVLILIMITVNFHKCHDRMVFISLTRDSLPRGYVVVCLGPLIEALVLATCYYCHKVSLNNVLHSPCDYL